MRNNFFITFLVITFLIVILNACKKKHVCDCNYTFTWADSTTYEDKYSFEIPRSKKSVAKDSCQAYQEYNTNWRYTYNCSLTY